MFLLSRVLWIISEYYRYFFKQPGLECILYHFDFSWTSHCIWWQLNLSLLTNCWLMQNRFQPYNLVWLLRAQWGLIYEFKNSKILNFACPFTYFSIHIQQLYMSYHVLPYTFTVYYRPKKYLNFGREGEHVASSS